MKKNAVLLSVVCILLMLFSYKRYKYKEFDVADIAGVYINGGNPEIRFLLKIDQNTKVTGWVLYKGKKRPVYGDITSHSNSDFYFRVFEDNYGKAEYNFYINATEGQNFLLCGNREIDINGHIQKESYCLLKAWGNPFTYVSADFNLGEIWADSLGEFFFCQSMHIEGHPKYTIDNIQFYENKICYYTGYHSPDIDTIGPVKNMIWGKCSYDSNLYKIVWYKHNDFFTDTAYFQKVLIKKSDTSFYILQYKNRCLNLIEPAHIVDSI